MLSREEIEVRLEALDSFIESLEDVGYRNLLGADPQDAERTLQQEKALAKVLRALVKAHHDLEALVQLCDA